MHNTRDRSLIQSSDCFTAVIASSTNFMRAVRNDAGVVTFRAVIASRWQCSRIIRVLRGEAIYFCINTQLHNSATAACTTTVTGRSYNQQIASPPYISISVKYLMAVRNDDTAVRNDGSAGLTHSVPSLRAAGSVAE